MVVVVVEMAVVWRRSAGRIQEEERTKDVVIYNRNILPPSSVTSTEIKLAYPEKLWVFNSLI